MKTTTRTIDAGLILAMRGTTAASAGDRVMQLFDRIDADGDGRISQSEAETARDAQFARMDANGDGSFTLEEMSEAARRNRAERLAKRFERMDGNGDGSVARDEFAEAGRERFRRMDTDGDGIVTREEIEARLPRRGG